MKEFISCGAGEGRFRIGAQARRCGDDWCVAVCGGEKHHVGAVSLAQYEPERGSATVSTLTAYTHRDDAVAASYAKAIASACRCTASVTVGIHVDDAGEAELASLGANCEACLRSLLDALEEEI